MHEVQAYMARLQIKIKPNSKENRIISENPFVVAIKAMPEKGKANAELIKFLSKKLGKQVRIVSGFGSSNKTIEVF